MRQEGSQTHPCLLQGTKDTQAQRHSCGEMLIDKGGKEQPQMHAGIPHNLRGKKNNRAELGRFLEQIEFLQPDLEVGRGETLPSAPCPQLHLS